MAETRLESVPEWPEALVARAKEAWITTAEQVVALSATPRGVQSLAEQLHVPEDEARHLVEAARAQLTPEARAAMEEAVDTSEYGRGVRPPRERDDDNP